MNADQFVFSIAGNPAMKLSGLFSDDGKVNNIYLDVNGWVKANGLEIWGERSEWREDGTREPISGTYQMNAKIDSNGNIYGWDAYFNNAYMENAYVQGTVEADSGRIGSIHIEPVSYSLYDDATHVLWQRLENSWNGSVFERSGFKLGVGKRALFDSNPAFLEIFNYANAFSDKDNRYGIKVAGHMNAALWSAITAGINPPTRRPNDDLMVAGFFDGGIYCTSSVHLGNVITTTCSSHYKGSGVMVWGNDSTNNQGEAISGNDRNPVAGRVYGGVTFDGGSVDLDKVRFVVVNGLIVNVYKE